MHCTLKTDVKLVSFNYIYQSLNIKLQDNALLAYEVFEHDRLMCTHLISEKEINLQTLCIVEAFKAKKLITTWSRIRLGPHS